MQSPSPSAEKEKKKEKASFFLHFSKQLRLGHTARCVVAVCEPVMDPRPVWPNRNSNLRVPALSSVLVLHGLLLCSGRKEFIFFSFLHYREDTQEQLSVSSVALSDLLDQMTPPDCSQTATAPKTPQKADKPSKNQQSELWEVRTSPMVTCEIFHHPEQFFRAATFRDFTQFQ